MTATPSPSNSPNSKTFSSPFKVVPPTSDKKTPLTQETPPIPISSNTQAVSQPSAASSFPYRRIFLIGGVFVGLGLISQVPVANWVNAEARIEPAPTSHQMVYTEIPGTLTEFLVQPNQSVKENQSIAIISTDDMDVEISSAQAQFEEALSSFKSASLQMNSLQARVNEANVRESAVRRQVEELRQELEHLPEIDKLHQEIAALRSNIVGLHSEREGQTKNLAIVQGAIKRFKGLIETGAIAQKELDNLLIQESTLISGVQTRESEVNAIEKQIAGKRSEIQIVTNRKHQELKLRQDELTALTTARQTASVELETNRVGVASREPLLKTLKEELERRQEKQQKHQVLKAKTSGLVISQDFHRLLGKKMPAGEPVLEIADLSQLVAIIEVPQADSDIVKTAAKVTFHPLEPGLASYTTRLEKMELVMQPDPSQQKQLLRVRAVINNSQGRLIPGAKVYAQIESEKMPLYQKMQREIMKLFNFRKYGFGG